MTTEMRGYELSSHQLDLLWKLDFKLASEFLGLPLRTCKASPVESWGHPMETPKFERLKLQIHRMWLRAAIYFSCHQNDHGWGLQVNDLCEKNLSLTENSFTVLGWLARAPSPHECPTGHRYLRSPIGTNLYLGGPISLANWSSTPTVRCRASSTKNPASQGNFYVTTVKPIPVGVFITWNYGLVTKEPHFYSEHEWQPNDCCSQMFPDAVSHAKCSTKKQKVHPTFKRARIVECYRFCVYCGINLEKSSDYSNPVKSQSPKKNSKPHFALHHTVQLCLDQKLEIDSESEGVSYSQFFSHLHIVCRVISLLENHHYRVVPACHIFQVLGRGQLPESASSVEKEQFFSDFMCEARDAFQKYKVLYVRGITIPSCYEDLLPVCETTYKDVSWERATAPRSNVFSVKDFVQVNEMSTLDREIQVEMENIVKQYSEL